MPPIPHVFISATSSDLAIARETVTKALLEIDCHPEVQEAFETAAGDIRELEKGKISDCQAVIHIVGKVYGAEPNLTTGSNTADATSPPQRRSYTQLEYDAALALPRPVYRFIATDEFYQNTENLPENWKDDEDAEKKDLQTRHRETILAGNDIYYEFSSLEELRELVLKLPEVSESWKAMVELITAELEEEKTDSRNFLKHTIVGLVCLVAILLGLLIFQQYSHTREIEQGRILLTKVLDSKKPPVTALEEASKELQLTPEETIKRIDAFQKSPANPNDETDTRLREVARKFVLEGFTPAEFTDYVSGMDFSQWKPELLVLHHTVTPTLEQWNNGDPISRMKGLQSYFTGRLGWSGGPHLFIDEEKIWVFNALNQPGIHAREWNRTSIGVDMVGNYDNNPLPHEIRDNAIHALATLANKLDLDQTRLRFHREDPSTNKTCPGNNVSKEEIQTLLKQEIENLSTP